VLQQTLFEIELGFSQRNILILIIVLLAISVPHAAAQTNTQLSLTLVGGQNTTQYVTPAGQTTTLQMEILNSEKSDVYLLQGRAYLDPNLNGTWQLIHSEELGSFHLRFLQSAIWTFNLPVPTNIQATNATNGTPQVDLLIKIVYQCSGASQCIEQGIFMLGVPGAIVQKPYDMILYTAAGLLIVVCIASAYVITKRRRKR
jgi:hypothetical protein